MLNLFPQYKYFSMYSIILNIRTPFTDVDYVKPKRGGNSGIAYLNPFPRTGGSDPDFQNWENTLNSFEEYEGNW